MLLIVTDEVMHLFREQEIQKWSDKLHLIRGSLSLKTHDAVSTSILRRAIIVPRRVDVETTSCVYKVVSFKK